MDRSFRDEEQQHFGALQRIDDLLAPEFRGVDGTLVDPQRHTLSAQLGGELQDPILVTAGIAEKDLCRLRHVRSGRVALLLCERLTQSAPTPWWVGGRDFSNQ